MPYYRRIKDLRIDNDKTQKQIAEMLELKQPNYYRYESGERDIPTEIIKKLAKYYNITADYILELTDEPRPLYGRRI